MLTLTLLTNKDGTKAFQTEHNHLYVIGEFLTKDARIMSDFIRALLTTEDEETIPMDACLIETKDAFFIIKHLHNKELPIVTLPKERMIQVLDIWEDFLMQRNTTQWIFFKQEEFGLQNEDQNLLKKLNEMGKKLTHLKKNHNEVE